MHPDQWFVTKALQHPAQYLSLYGSVYGVYYIAFQLLLIAIMLLPTGEYLAKKLSAIRLSRHLSQRPWTARVLLYFMTAIALFIAFFEISLMSFAKDTAGTVVTAESRFFRAQRDIYIFSWLTANSFFFLGIFYLQYKLADRPQPAASI